MPLTLLSKAEALIALGRGAEAGPVLAEVEAGIAPGRDTDARRPRRVAWLRAYWAVTEGRLAEVPRLAAAAEVSAGASPDSIALGAHLLTEYARSQLGRPGAPASTVIRWLDEMAPGRTRRDMRVWTVRILLARREPDRAKRVLEDGWVDPATLDNPELRWRMAAHGELSGGSVTPGLMNNDVKRGKLSGIRTSSPRSKRQTKTRSH